MRFMDGQLASIVVGLATAVVIVAVAITPLLSPQWVAFEQGRARAAAWTGFSDADLRVATEALLADLILGGDFDVAVNGRPVLNDRERSHMADVRAVFRGLWVLALAGALVLAIAAGRAERGHRWASVRRGALGLVISVVVVGVIGLVAFDQLFEVFHQVFFPAGSYLFDPTTDRLVQLFPFQFWEESAMVAGGTIIALALVVAWFAGRRLRTVALEAGPDRTLRLEPHS
ncbi:MAG: TIGR01906 family membrane protein [Chloroflexi bacterium]|nr:TIGR01906 family membrane protein [Chloroflexota bacterium]